MKPLAVFALAFSVLAFWNSAGAADADRPAVASQPLPVAWDKSAAVLGAAKTMTYSGTVQDAAGQPTLLVKATPIAGVKADGTTAAVAATCLPVGPVLAGSAGLSFEYQGDGSDDYASVMVGENNALFTAFEAVFPLKSTEWQTMTLRWTDFTKNDLPWGPRMQFSPETVFPTPEKLQFIGFGRGWCFHKHYTPKFSFAIRNLRLLTTLPPAPAPTYSKGLTHVKSLIEQRQPLHILMLGDSITDFGEGKSHGYYCAQRLKQKWTVDATIANAGIAGHSVRAGTIVLPRAIRMMPKPDLVCIMYGANDCKAADGKSGFNEAVFARNLEILVDQVRYQTQGQADIILISGVPRLDGKTWTTTGAIEKILPAIQQTAEKKETAFCDSFPVFLDLPVAQKKLYYKDTIHQKPEGLAKLGQLLFETIETAVAPAR